MTTWTIRQLLDAYVEDYTIYGDLDLCEIDKTMILAELVIWMKGEVKPELGDELLDFQLCEEATHVTVRKLLDAYTAKHDFVCKTADGIISLEMLKAQLGDKLLDFKP